jgi:tripartite-type tricarboxylate transporter receptor subunit TctC
MRSEEVRNRWIALGVEPAPMTPQAFDQWVRDDIASSIKLARTANIKAD